MPKEFILPDLGEGIHEAQIVRVLIQPGQMVKEDESLVEVETDKAAVEIPSPYAGVATTVHVKEGQTVNVGQVLVTFDDGQAAPAQGKKEAAPAQRPGAPSSKEAQPAPARSSPAAPSRAEAPAARRPLEAQPAKPATRVPSGTGREPSEAAPEPEAAEGGRTTAAAAPAVRKLARELGVDLDSLRGSGPGGRVTKEDVEQAAGQGAAPAAPAGRPGQPPARGDGPPTRREIPPAVIPGTPDKDKWGAIRRAPLNQIRKTIAAQMSRSAFTVPHVTHGDEADITELEAVRGRLNELTGGDPKLTPMTFLIRALCVALRKFPIFNASFDHEGEQIIYKEYINMGIAVDTERGLIVPVIRDADKLTLRGIASALRSISERVRTNQFAIEDLRGGTFTITNVGALGGTFSTPIINYPEVAILGLGRSKKVPVLRDGKLAESLIMPISLSFDHRATDGANAARFTREVISFLESPMKLLLD